MIDYRAGDWGLHVAFGIQGSLAPRAFVMALPNALLTLLIASLLLQAPPDSELLQEKTVDAAKVVIAAVTPIMIFILYNRSRTSYDRWWEGGTLLQKTRGEWFNAFSSIMAFTSTKPELQDQVDAYVHLLTRLMSLLMCCGLQQVSPDRDRPFEIFDLDGIEPASMEFLNAAPDKVEIILQWIQRSMVLHQQTGVLPVAPPILSRAFQEVSRGIVNLQNARKIADFPYPYPLAQISMILQLLHWASTPFAAALALPRAWAVVFSFFSIFVLWCIHFNALDLEFPFGSRVNDLPMQEFQQEWNNSICTLVQRMATKPPKFDYDPEFHGGLSMVMSDASDLYVPKSRSKNNRQKIAVIKVAESRNHKTPEVSMSLGMSRQKSEKRRMPTMPDSKGGGLGTNSVGTNSFGLRGAAPSADAKSSAAAASAVGKPAPGKESSDSQPSEAATKPNSESSSKKEHAEVLLNTNDTAAPAASTASPSHPSRKRASGNGNSVSQALTPVNLPIEPLVLSSVEGPALAPDAKSNARQDQNKPFLESIPELPSAAEGRTAKQDSKESRLKEESL